MVDRILTVDYYDRVVKVIFRDTEYYNDEQSQKMDGAIGNILTYYDGNDGIDFLIMGVDPSSIKYRGFSSNYQNLTLLDGTKRTRFVQKLIQKASEPREFGTGLP